jgi:hypothetical protein
MDDSEVAKRRKISSSEDIIQSETNEEKTYDASGAERTWSSSLLQAAIESGQRRQQRNDISSKSQPTGLGMLLRMPLSEEDHLGARMLSGLVMDWAYGIASSKHLAQTSCVCGGFPPAGDRGDHCNCVAVLILRKSKPVRSNDEQFHNQPNEQESDPFPPRCVPLESSLDHANDTTLGDKSVYDPDVLRRISVVHFSSLRHAVRFLLALPGKTQLQPYGGVVLDGFDHLGPATTKEQSMLFTQAGMYFESWPLFSSPDSHLLPV